jgi:hypothetical protein
MPCAGAAEVLRLGGRVVGEGDLPSLLERFVGVGAADRGPLPSSHGSFFTAVRGAGFPTPTLGIVFLRTPEGVDAESAPATMVAV